jgi:hypothetical protein
MPTFNNSSPTSRRKSQSCLRWSWQASRGQIFYKAKSDSIDEDTLTFITYQSLNYHPLYPITFDRNSKYFNLLICKVHLCYYNKSNRNATKWMRKKPHAASVKLVLQRRASLAWCPTASIVHAQVALRNWLARPKNSLLSASTADTKKTSLKWTYNTFLKISA